MRAGDRVEVAAEAVAVLAQDRRLVDELLEPDLPVRRVGMLGRDAERHALAATADPDLGELLDRLRIAVRAIEVDVCAGKRDRLLGPQSLHRVEGLVERSEAITGRRELVAVGAVLALVPAGAQAKDQPSARDNIDLRRFLREQAGVSIRRARDELPEADRLRVLRERRERREGFEHMGRLAPGHGLDMVVDPEVVVAELLGPLRDLDGARPRLGGTPTGVLELPALRRERAESQWSGLRVAQAGAGSWSASSWDEDSLKSHHCTSTIIGSR